jgi:hypothetical protein
MGDGRSTALTSAQFLLLRRVEQLYRYEKKTGSSSSPTPVGEVMVSDLRVVTLNL